MSRLNQLALAAILLLVAAAIAAIYALEWREKQIDGGPSSAAYQEEFLAARLYLQRHHVAMLTGDNPQLLGRLPPRATLMLDLHNDLLDPQQVEALLGWVRRGGHLLLSMGDDSQNTLLAQRLRVSVVELTAAERSRLNALYKKQNGELDWSLRYPLANGSTAQTAADSDIRLVAHRNQWTLRLSNPAGLQWVGRNEGKGRIEVLIGFGQWTNSLIEEYDHAWLLRNLVGKGPLYLLRLESWPTLWERLWQLIPEALAATLALLLLWIWQGNSRIGPLLPAPTAERRQWMEHIEACARQLWSSGHGLSLLHLLANRQPGESGEAALRRNVTQLTGSEAEANRLIGAASRNETKFTQLAAALQRQADKEMATKSTEGTGVRS